MNNKNQDQHLPQADTGNASNPSPHNKGMEPASNNQLLNEKAEKYLRESANIEDEPDPQDQFDADEVVKKEN
jgi:hypothetical protein